MPETAKAFVRVGSCVRAPWREHGDDTTLTGTVTAIRKGCAEITWHGNGDCTAEGDESRIPLANLTADDVVTF